MSNEIQPALDIPRESMYARAETEGAIRQGEIITGLTQYKLDISAENDEFIAVSHPYALVVSQDCDLDWDHKARIGATRQEKLIPNILFCEVVEARVLRANVENRRAWDNVQINKNERYQFLQRIDSEYDTLSEGLPELGIDFKRYFTLPADEVYFRIRQQNGVYRRCRLISPYVEHFSSRFCYFQSRIALPAEHFSEPEG